MAYRPSIEVFEDPAADTGGQAVIRVAGLPRQPAETDFTIRRFGYDKGVLGVDGWQGPDARLQPLSASFADGTLELTVGPEVVDAIDVGTPVEIELPGAGVRDTLPWPNVPPSVHGGFGGRTFAFTPRAPARAPEPREDPTVIAAPPPPPPEPPQQAEDAEAPTLVGGDLYADAGRSDPPFERLRDDWAPMPADPEMPPPEDDYDGESTRPFEDRPEGRGGFPWGVLIGVLLFVMLIGIGGAYYFLHEELGLPFPFETAETAEDGGGNAAPGEVEARDPVDPIEPPRPGDGDPPPQPPRPSEPAEPPVAEVPAAPQPGQSDAPQVRDSRTPPFDFARSLLAADGSAERAFDLATRYLEQGDTDVALLLLEHAEAQGYAPALTAIGRLYDPVHFEPQRSPFTHANPDRAADYYRRAAESGDADAQAALDDLESWLERAAEQGDPSAQEVLERLRR